MGFDTYYKLDKLLNKHGPKSFGSICQFFLEICLRENGYLTRGRAVERPDIVAEKIDERYAIECKYQKGGNLVLTKRDVDGVMDLSSAGFIPLIAFLMMDIDAQWCMIEASKIRQGKYNKISLRIYEITELSDKINTIFPKVVDQNYELVLNRGVEGIRSRIK